MKTVAVALLLSLVFIHSANAECSEVVGSDCLDRIPGTPGPNTAVVYRTEQEAVSMGRCYATCVQDNEVVSGYKISG